MLKKTSKQLIFSSILVAFSLLLASCQSMLASTEEMERNRAVEAWGANLTAQGERYLEEMGQASVPWVELKSDVPAPESREISLIELGSDIPPVTDVIVAAYTPGIEIRRTRLATDTYLIVYTVKSIRPAWVVFHEDNNGVAGAILKNIYVSSGTHKIFRTEFMREKSSEQTHVMLHEDFGRIGLFEFPGPDGPVYVDNEIVNELCFCPF